MMNRDGRPVARSGWSEQGVAVGYEPDLGPPTTIDEQ